MQLELASGICYLSKHFFQALLAASELYGQHSPRPIHILCLVPAEEVGALLIEDATLLLGIVDALAVLAIADVAVAVALV
jgi:hypothetical protein